MRNMFEVFTETSKRAIINARLVCEEKCGRSIRGKHLLVGVLSVPDSDIALLFRHHSLEPDAARRRVMSSIKRQRRQSPNEIPFLGETPVALRSIQSKVTSGLLLEVKPIHILIALASVPNGSPSRFLNRWGIKNEELERLA
jgi:ATP-dependent Clp protease ATP-binding subunit ClpA